MDDGRDVGAGVLKRRLEERRSFEIKSLKFDPVDAKVPEDARGRSLDYGIIERDGRWTWRTDIAGMKRAWSQGDPPNRLYASGVGR